MDGLKYKIKGRRRQLVAHKQLSLELRPKAEMSFGQDLASIHISSKIICLIASS